jgi:hypothetical protein
VELDGYHLACTNGGLLLCCDVRPARLGRGGDLLELNSDKSTSLATHVILDSTRERDMMGRKQARFCAVLLGMTTTTAAAAALATGSRDAGVGLSCLCARIHCDGRFLGLGRCSAVDHSKPRSKRNWCVGVGTEDAVVLPGRCGAAGPVWGWDGAVWGAMRPEDLTPPKRFKMAKNSCTDKAVLAY